MYHFFDDDCKEAFETLKKALTTAPIVQPLDWNLPFKIMCDASDFAIGVVLGQRVEKKLNVIHYASKTLDAAVDGCRKNMGYHPMDPKIQTQGAERGRSWIATKHGDGSLETSNAKCTAERETPSFTQV
jgi:hypothetical protein